MKLLERFKGEKQQKQTTGEALVNKAYELFEEFKSAYASEWERLNRNEHLYLGKHWDDMGDMNRNNGDPRPMTPVINSTVENLQADLMDNYPQATIQPENPQDKAVADVVGALVRQNHDAMGYRRVYAHACHDLLVGGYCVQEVGYDTRANYGIGSAYIRYIDQHNILFDPQVTDIQDGRAVFKISPRTIVWLEQRYPEHAGQFVKDPYTLETDSDVTYDQEKSVLMLEYWWREYDTAEQRWRVHMALMAGHQLLEDSREAKPEGYFAMGVYPFVVKPLLRRKNSALGYGIPDLFGDMQKYSDKLDQIALKNAQMASHNKLLVTEASGFDADDLRDWSKDVHRGESLNGVTWFPTPSLPAYFVQQPSLMRQSIKEESGANDFSRGSTSSGVTAASAIAALQEMSSKRSRMIAMQMHEAFKECVRMEVEFEREYNILPREVLLTVDGQQQVATFESAIMERETAIGNRVPVEFMISIKVERENRWSVTAHNELMLQMVQLGVLQPNQAVELMEFEGKETILGKLANAGPSPEEMAQMQAMQDQQALAASIAELPAPEQMNNQVAPVG